MTAPHRPWITTNLIANVRSIALRRDAFGSTVLGLAAMFAVTIDASAWSQDPAPAEPSQEPATNPASDDRFGGAENAPAI